MIPIVLEPCDWALTDLRGLKVLPRDGKTVSEWTNENNAFLDVVQELLRILDEVGMPHATTKREAMIGVAPVRAGSRRYCVKRDFDAIEDLRGRFASTSAVSFTCTTAAKTHENGTAHITVH